MGKYFIVDINILFKVLMYLIFIEDIECYIEKYEIDNK